MNILSNVSHTHHDEQPGLSGDHPINIIDDEAADSQASGDSGRGGRRNPPRGKQHRNFVFTINNPPDQYINSPDNFWLVLKTKIDCLEGGVFSVEQAQTRHLQGFFHCNQPVRLSTAKNVFRAGVLKGWVAPARDPKSAALYCCKEDETHLAGPYWYGTLTADSLSNLGQGKRTEIDGVAKLIQSGANLLSVAQQHPNTIIRYPRGVEKLIELLQQQQPRNFKTTLTIYWGVAGSGKSRRAWSEAGNDFYALPAAKDANVIWWPGYHGQHTVVLDDYYGWIPLAEFLRLSDRYPHKVRTHGDHWCEFTSKRIIITSNSHPLLWYASAFLKAADSKPAFERRIDTIEQFTTTEQHDAHTNTGPNVLVGLQSLQERALAESPDSRPEQRLEQGGDSPPYSPTERFNESPYLHPGWAIGYSV